MEKLSVEQDEIIEELLGQEGPTKPSPLSRRKKRSDPPYGNAPPRTKKRTQHEKRVRQSGKQTDKPYISSSLGDMCRHMIRMACTENTLHMTDPPTVEFYDYWHKFAVPPPPPPNQHVDLRRVSIARLKMHTSSFQLHSRMDASQADLHTADSIERKHDPTHQLNPTLSDLWRGVRLSLSSESFISSSTKVSEFHDGVPLESGWTDQELSEYDALSESDEETGLQMTSDHHGSSEPGGGHSTVTKSKMAGTVSSNPSTSRQESLGELHKQDNMVAASLQRLHLEEWQDNLDMAAKQYQKRNSEVVDHFYNDLDDTFLVDAVSFGQLPDLTFTQDFDYFNEDPMYREREKLKQFANNETQVKQVR